MTRQCRLRAGQGSLDHRDRLSHRVGRLEIGGRVEAGERQRRPWAPGALSGRRKLDEFDEASRILALLIIGARIPLAPASGSRLASANSPTGTRTMVGLPASATLKIERIAPAKSTAPCCMSRVTASNASRASCSATAGSFMATQAQSASRFVARRPASIPTTGSFIRVPMKKKVDASVAPARRSQVVDRSWRGRLLRRVNLKFTLPAVALADRRIPETRIVMKRTLLGTLAAAAAAAALSASGFAI